ncbi:hypothetical protein APHAL10511_001509 [Amanita phalloides]|nr:hypothetical protein APHAL10511_001509 [Amanita phalloides]
MASQSTPSPRQSVLVLRYGNFRPVATAQKRSLSDIEKAARQFFNLSTNAKLKFSTTLVAGELMQIDPDLWPHIYTTVSSLWIEDDSPPLYTPVPSSASSPTQPGRLLRLRIAAQPFRTFLVIIHSNSNVNALKEMIRDQEGIPIKEQWLIYQQTSMEDDQLLQAYGINQDTTIVLIHNLKIGKPVIYLYPPASFPVNVNLSLVPSWKFSAIYPLAPVETKSTTGRETISWDVFAEPDGKLRLSDGLEVSYLYWEAETRAVPGIATPPVSRPQTPALDLVVAQRFDPARPVLTPQDSVLLRVPADLTKYLDQALLAMGLHTEARTSFITYWLPSFVKHEYIALRFLEQSVYESAARLDITPHPDVVTRVFMLFRGVASRDLAIWTEAEQRANDMHVAEWGTIIGVNVEKMKREDLFRVLEWGGMEVAPVES